MKRTLFPRLMAAGLSLLLLASPATHALTPEQCAELLQTYYVDQVPQSVLEKSTVRDMLDALGDPFTQYFTAEEYEAFNASMSDSKLVGIGVKFALTDAGLLLSEILDNSPAQKSGLESGDLIVAVDGKSVLGQDTDTVSDWIQGEPGTTVRITYLRNGNQQMVTLIRDIVTIPATTTELLDNHIGYIRCSTFGSETVGHFRQGIENYGEKVDVWIVDLRSNLGGATEAATQSANLFTGPGDMAYLRNSDNQYGAYRTTDSPLTNAPVIVLVDGLSASASEIFAAAIRDHGAGIVVGSRTFGKGVAQIVFDQRNLPKYFSGGDAIKITSHRFFSPLGNTPDQLGVIPDLLVPDEYTGAVAYLLSASNPSNEASNMLRLQMNWNWYIDLGLLAEKPEYRDVLAVLLDAIPIDLEFVELWQCSNPTAGWHQTSPQEVAQELGLTYASTLFPDQTDSKYRADLSVMQTYNLIHGYDDGLFHPQNTLTRAELCQLLASALNLSVSARPCSYADVAEDAWYQPAVTAMSNFGLVQGDDRGLFHPDEPIDHEQFITIMGRLGKRINMFLYDAALGEMPQDLSKLEEFSGYADWAKPSAWLMVNGWHGYFVNNINLLWAPINEIAAANPTTRDEAVETLYQLLYRTGALPKNRNIITE